MDDADRAVRATGTHVTRRHHRQIGQRTAPELQSRQKCGLDARREVRTEGRRRSRILEYYSQLRMAEEGVPVEIARAYGGPTIFNQHQLGVDTLPNASRIKPSVAQQRKILMPILI